MVFKRVTWDDVAIGDVVYIDNYQDGKFPHADPKISGPFTVAVGNGCGRWLDTKKGTGFGYYPNNLLKRDTAGEMLAVFEEHFATPA
jgi:hypothetical protein